MPETQVKQTGLERVKELTDKLEAGMKDLFQSDKYRDFLKTMSHFHHYSRRNIMLINMQHPGATRVASYNLWKEKFNRQVKRGEEGIRIFAPIKDKEPEKKLMEKLDPETGAPLLDENGKVIMEEMAALQNGIRFKLVPVFDVSQTYGEPLPELAENLTGNVEHYMAFMDALKDISPLPIELEPMNENQDGYCRFGEKIGIREGMSEIQTVSAAIHEITHSRLHDRSAVADNTAPKSKVVREVEAESVAYVVAQHFGIETSPNSFGYLAEYGSRDLKELNASLDTIRKEASSLIGEVGDRFSQICNERGVNTIKNEELRMKNEMAEPQYTAETRTETVACVDFEVTEIKPQTPPRENETAKSPFRTEELREMEIYQFAADYTDHITDVHGTYARMDKAEREDAINGIAGLVQKGNIAGIREALDRSLHHSKYPDQSAALTERLNKMFQQPHTRESEAAKAPPRPEPDETMPDPAISISEMNIYGYQYEGMLPLTLEKALELYDNDQPIYLLYPDNSEAMALNRCEIETFDGVFGIDRIEWERAAEYSALSSKNCEAVKEYGIINGNTDMFGIYQLKNTEELRYHRLASLEQLEADNLAVDRSNYELAYTAPLPPKETLDNIYRQFNTDRPKDYAGRSLSVSDVIVIQRGGDVTSHYVDNFGFAEIPSFLGNERKLQIAATTVQADISDDKPTSQPVMECKLSGMIGADLNKHSELDNKTSSPLTDKKNIPVYKQTLDGARCSGELEAWRESKKINSECAEAIDKAIKDSNYELYHYDLKTAAKTVTEEYGAERVAWVLANTVQKQYYDGRYSSSNQAWAKGFDVPKDSSGTVNTHPTVVDGFITRYREGAAEREKQKPSIITALKQGADKSRQQPDHSKETKKSKGMEM